MMNVEEFNNTFLATYKSIVPSVVRISGQEKLGSVSAFFCRKYSDIIINIPFQR